MKSEPAYVNIPTNSLFIRDITVPNEHLIINLARWQSASALVLLRIRDQKGERRVKYRYLIPVHLFYKAPFPKFEFCILLPFRKQWDIRPKKYPVSGHRSASKSIRFLVIGRLQNLCGDALFCIFLFNFVGQPVKYGIHVHAVIGTRPNFPYTKYGG